MVQRAPLNNEPISGRDTVLQYDISARRYMMPEYKYTVWKLMRKGIKNGRVLDIGTGTGLLAIELAEAKNCQFEVVGIDISENMISKAKENIQQTNTENNIDFVMGTAANMPFTDESFDAVISYASLHHWFNPVAVFDEVHRVLKKGGTAIIRDNLRIYQYLWGKPYIGFLSAVLNIKNRERWDRAISASYTIAEVKQILGKSHLHDFKIYADAVFVDLCIEYFKKD